jgi:hypothetical protein
VRAGVPAAADARELRGAPRVVAPVSFPACFRRAPALARKLLDHIGDTIRGSLCRLRVHDIREGERAGQC